MDLEVCKSCGKTHDALSGSIPVSLPTEAAQIPERERDHRVWSNGELCVIDDARYYLYGSIELSIHDHPDGFSWGAWVEIDEEHFFWYQDLLDLDGREDNEAFPALLATDIPFYPVTMGLALTVHVQPNGWRPLFRLNNAAHPLVEDQKAGVSVERMQAIKQWFLSLSESKAAARVTPPASPAT